MRQPFLSSRSVLAATAAILLMPSLSVSTVMADHHELSITSKPVWVSGSKNCGGDGNARLLDVDQDGDLDLVTSVPNPRRWAIFANEDGKLSEKPMWESEETTDCDHISVLDFDKDGKTDLAATHESHCTLYLNDEKREKRFGRLPDWETGLYTDANQIDFGDFDGDGDYDLLMASGLPVYCLAIFENKDGTPAKLVSRTLGPRLYSESSIFADVDSDGDLDVIGTYPKKGTIVVYKNAGAGKFDEGTEVYSDPKVPWCQRVYCIDIDNDGDMEIFCAKGPWGGPGASIALTQENGKMQVVWRSADDTGFHGFDFRDIDEDGDLDIAAADWGGRSVSVFLQENGEIAEEPAWIAKTPAPVHEVMLGDIDGDGDLDIAAGGLDQAMLFENLRK